MENGSVLVVDDSKVVRAVVTAQLQRAGFQVTAAENGADALKELAGRTYDVVVTDLRMPGLDGFGVLSEVKGRGLDTETIILTGTHARDMDRAVRALRLGAHDYLTKPLGSAGELVLSVERAVEKKRLKEANRRLVEELTRLTTTDALTGAGNRRSFDEALGREVAQAKRHLHPMALIMLDIDYFKKVNDTHGHQGGDEVLRAFASLAAPLLRQGDALYRYGGEEFAAVLPHADRLGAIHVAERIVQTVAASALRIDGKVVRFTVSAGVSWLTPSDRDGTPLVARADEALYKAKRNGRNRVQAASATREATGLKRAMAMAS